MNPHRNFNNISLLFNKYFDAIIKRFEVYVYEKNIYLFIFSEKKCIFHKANFSMVSLFSFFYFKIKTQSGHTQSKMGWCEKSHSMALEKQTLRNY